MAFSTELDDPNGRFFAGDLLTNKGAAIPNTILLRKFQVGHDLGLDGLQFIGAATGIIGFLNRAAELSRDDWFHNPGLIYDLLGSFKVDIWISTESNELRAATIPIYDGDLLSVYNGAIVIKQADLLPLGVPAGLPDRGVDFGLDAVAASRNGDIRTVRFSTEILYRKEPAFTDGDVLKKGMASSLLTLRSSLPNRMPSSWAWMPCTSCCRLQRSGSGTCRYPQGHAEARKESATMLPMRFPTGTVFKVIAVLILCLAVIPAALGRRSAAG